MASPALATDAILASADPTVLCMGATAEAALRLWARLRLTGELIDRGQVAEAKASLGLALDAVRDAPEGTLRATALSSVGFFVARLKRDGLSQEAA